MPNRNATRSACRDLLLPAFVLLALAIAAHLAAAPWESWLTQLAALGSAAPALYLLLWLTLVPCGLPEVTLGLTAGFLFGPWPGPACAGAGLVLVDLFMHTLGRRWLRPRAFRPAPPGAAGARCGHGWRAPAPAGPPFTLELRRGVLHTRCRRRSLADLCSGAARGVAGRDRLCLAGHACGVQPPGSRRREWVRLVAPLVGGISLLVLAVVVTRYARRAGPGRDESSARSH